LRSEEERRKGGVRETVMKRMKERKEKEVRRGSVMKEMKRRKCVDKRGVKKRGGKENRVTRSRSNKVL